MVSGVPELPTYFVLNLICQGGQGSRRARRSDQIRTDGKHAPRDAQIPPKNQKQFVLAGDNLDMGNPIGQRNRSVVSAK
jgi:hypothetical protein